MQVVAESFAVKVSEVSAAGEVRRRAAALAASLNFDDTDQGAVSVIAAEMAKNIAVHAGDGEVIVRALRGPQSSGIELLALDKGKGMSDVARAMRDGYSTSGTSGTGLGAMARMSTVFDLFSIPGGGAAVLAQCWPRSTPATQRAQLMHIGVVQVPKAGEDVCGDQYAVLQVERDSIAIMIADGLGHGVLAFEAATQAVRIFLANSGVTVERWLDLMHAALRPTRGAAASITHLNLRTKELHFAGIGNVAGIIVGGETTRSMAAHNGTLGHSMRKVQSFTYPWPSDGVLVMHSDGLGTQWKLDKYPGLTRKHPSLIAGVLYRDFNRGRDDVTVIAAREPVNGGIAS